MTCSLVAKLLRMSEVDYRILWTTRLPAYSCFLACFFFSNNLKVSVHAVKIKRNKCLFYSPIQSEIFCFIVNNHSFPVNVFWTSLSSLITINRNTVSRGWLWWEIQNISAVVEFWDIQSHVDRLWRWVPSLIGIPLLLWQHTSSSGLLSYQNRGGIAVGSVLINLTCCYFL